MPIRLASKYVVPLQKEHDRSAFDCKNDGLNRYLKQLARQDAEKYVAAPFALVEPDAPVVRGYYTLASSLIPLDELPAELARKLPRYNNLPVTLQHAQQIASMAVVVDAKDDEAEHFYKHFNFLPFQRTPLRLFLPMIQIEKLFP
ncbi:hypothetical protein [Pseudoduganella aquatica]|uniref:hypothetical protein n=1 Tax=Pseudoduganella aquatica TaxID=2660641 RepID=UPI001E3EA8E0|nr:hypothetical protein [Pseudoduganella aquatica]